MNKAITIDPTDIIFGHREFEDLIIEIQQVRDSLDLLTDAFRNELMVENAIQAHVKLLNYISKKLEAMKSKDNEVEE